MPNGKVIDILAQVRNGVYFICVLQQRISLKQIIYEYSHPPNYRV